MNALSLSVSILSIVAAAVAGVLAARVLRDERRRSDARVAALARMSGTASWDLGEPAFLPEPGLQAADEPRSAVDDHEPFREPRLPALAGRRLALAGGIGAIVLAAGVIATLGWNGQAREAANNPPAAAPVPLELLSLSHSKTEGSLTVSGRVQNPQRGGLADGLTATVFLFGADGAFLTSGRAPLEVDALAAGAAAPFVVSIPVNGAVARYRVSFRDRNGQSVAHVDKRGAASLARSE